jgi:hypothetical protein
MIIKKLSDARINATKVLLEVGEINKIIMRKAAINISTRQK